MNQSDSLSTTSISANLLRGALELERTTHGLLPHRLPAWARAQCPDPALTVAESQSSGVRLVFRTAATVIELDTLRTKKAYRGAPPRPDGKYDLFINGQLTNQSSVAGGNVFVIDMSTGDTETQPGPMGTVRFDGLTEGVKDVEVWLPHNEITELVALRTDARVDPAPASQRRVWLHHGSSISHGSDAASPSATWPALAARAGGVELINLGLSGAALLDPFTARVMGDTPADLISVKIGINVVNLDVMRRRAFIPAVHGFLDTIRDRRPDVPLLVVGPLLCPIQEDTPGPGAPDFSNPRGFQFRATGHPAERAAGKLTLNVIREDLADIVRQRGATDPNLHYLDGRELYGDKDFAELPLPDQLHPDAATHHRIAERFAASAFGPSGPFGQG